VLWLPVPFTSLSTVCSTAEPKPFCWAKRHDLSFLHRISTCRATYWALVELLYEHTKSVHLVGKIVKNMIWLLFPLSDWQFIMIGPSDLLLVVYVVPVHLQYFLDEDFTEKHCESTLGWWMCTLSQGTCMEYQSYSTFSLYSFVNFPFSVFQVNILIMVTLLGAHC
jgi:hypothetical protein